MTKAPAFQFYVKDWLSDPQLKMTEHSTKGIWMDMLCYMWEAPERGELQGTRNQLMKMVGATEADFDQFINDAQQLCFCYVSVTDNGIITVRNRRMYRDEKDKKNNRERQQRHRDKQKDNGEITPPSSTASPSPKKIGASFPQKNLKTTGVNGTRSAKDAILEIKNMIKFREYDRQKSIHCLVFLKDRMADDPIRDKVLQTHPCPNDNFKRQQWFSLFEVEYEKLRSEKVPMRGG